MIRAQRHVPLDPGRTLQLTARDERDGSGVVELQVLGEALPNGEPVFGIVRIPLARARDTGRALTSIASELGVQP